MRRILEADQRAVEAFFMSCFKTPEAQTSFDEFQRRAVALAERACGDGSWGTFRSWYNRTCREKSSKYVHKRLLELLSYLSYQFGSSSSLKRRLRFYLFNGYNGLNAQQEAYLQPIADCVFRELPKVELTPSARVFIANLRERGDYQNAPILADLMEDEGCECAEVLDWLRTAKQYWGSPVFRMGD